MKIAVSQINTTVGDFEGNMELILNGLRRAEKEKANLVVFPELSVCGYPPRDLLEKPNFIEQNLKYVEKIAKATKNTAVVVGYVSLNDGSSGRRLFNSAGLLRNGEIHFVQHKTLLPEYDVFDEARHFEPAHCYGTYKLDDINLGLSLCEDIWSFFKFGGRRLYDSDPVQKVVDAGADMVINISASPFVLGKHDIRLNLAKEAAKRVSRPVIYCNLVGGNDELVFDGHSFAVDKNGGLLYEAKSFSDDFFVVDTENLKPVTEKKSECDESEVERALTVGLADYMRKCGFEKVVIGLSGGIDSAVVAALAVKAIGANNVMGVLMPSQYSSKESVDDAQHLAKNLGIVTCTVPINDIYDSYRNTLGFISDKKISVAEENIQARIRGNILMAISNKEGALVLSTGNKSEVSVGYCTLYGDMAGGLALISDVPKTMVYALAKYINRVREIIPRATLEKPPSAELRPNQKDEDSLPPYDILDPILRAYVEDLRSVQEIVALGYKKNVVEEVVKLIDRNEYKRRQSAPGIKVTSKAFGIGRRFPIARKS